MVVTAQCRNAVSPVLCIGRENVRRYFPERVDAIELLVGGLHIRCPLADSFWRDRPELHDPRLQDWINFSVYHKSVCKGPVQLELVPLGQNAFQLRPYEGKKGVQSATVNVVRRSYSIAI